MYPAGHNVVLYSADTKTQRLISGTLESEGITAMCVSANKKLLAVAERSEKAMITVYDLQTLKRRKVLMSTDAGSKVTEWAGDRRRRHLDLPIPPWSGCPSGQVAKHVFTGLVACTTAMHHAMRHRHMRMPERCC